MLITMQASEDIILIDVELYTNPMQKYDVAFRVVSEGIERFQESFWWAKFQRGLE